jgi:hypothetical protein
MSDPQLSRMLRRAGDEPSEQFVSALRSDLLAAFDDSAGSSSTSTDAVADVELRFAPAPDDGFVPLRKPEPVSPRRRWPLLAAAAVLVIAGTVAVMTRHRPPDKLTPATTVPHSFAQHLSVDVKTSAGATVHVEGEVDLPIAVESNESSVQPIHDVLLLPKLAATVTNQGGQPVTIAQAYVEVFLRGDRSNCVVNLGGCETALITGQTADGTAPTVLGAGQGLALSDGGKSSRISVPAGEVAFAIDQVHDGSMVVGYAVVVKAGASGDDVASVVFDRAGQQVSTCASTPEDCLGPDRAALGDDAVPDPSASTPVTIPSSNLPAGVHTVGAFRVPITFTTTRKWEGVLDTSSNVTFRRTNRDPAVVDETVVIAVIPANAERQMTEDIISTCPDSFDRTVTHTTMYGQDALTVSGVLTADCGVLPDYSSQFVPAGETMRITATDLGDGHFLLGVAASSNDLWPEFSDEVDKLFASIVPA